MARTQTRIRSLFVAIALLAVLPVQVPAQEASSRPAAVDLAQLEQGVPTAPVTIEGAVILRGRGISSYPAEERARTIAGRIREVAANPGIRPDMLRIEQTEFSSQIVADKQLVMNVYDVDANTEGVPRQVLANLYLGQIRSAVVAYRMDRNAPALRRAGIAALVATLVFAVSTGLVVRHCRHEYHVKHPIAAVTPAPTKYSSVPWANRRLRTSRTEADGEAPNPD
jgi:hypothetical protein